VFNANHVQVGILVAGETDYLISNQGCVAVHVIGNSGCGSNCGEYIVYAHWAGTAVFSNEATFSVGDVIGTLTCGDVVTGSNVGLDNFVGFPSGSVFCVSALDTVSTKNVQGICHQSMKQNQC
jgi:hypothetical protein